MRKEKPPKNNLTRGSLLALKSLRNNEDIVILKANKGGATIVMNKEDYVMKMRDHFYSGESYKKLKYNPIS